MSSESTYWLAAPKEEVGPLAMERIKRFRDYLASSGRLDQQRELYNSYHGVTDDRSADRLTASGEQGELTLAKLNHYRSVLQNLHTLVTSEPPAAFCKASNTDSASTEQATLGNGILEDYAKTRGLGEQFRYACEVALAQRKAWLVIDWDFTLGKKVASEPVQAADGSQYMNDIREGDATFRVKDVTQVAFDPNLETFDKLPWFAVVDKVNKWDLAARFPENPELQEKIRGMGMDKATLMLYDLTAEACLNEYPTDLIYVWTIYAAQSPALEEGRKLVLLEDGTTLFDTALPFDEIPAVPCDPAKELRKQFGHTPGLDMLGLQDALDGGVSSLVTNLLSYAANCLWNKPGQDIAYQELPNGMQVVESESKPEPLELSKMPPHSIEVLKLLKQMMEEVANLNSTARGVPPSANMSGASMALLQSIAIKLSSGLQASYVALIEKVYNILLKMLQEFADGERVSDIGGHANRAVVARWSKEKISRLRRVVVEIGSPLAQTVSGRLEIARDLKEMGEIQTSDDYYAVLATGRLDTALSPKQKLIALVSAENEQIAQGITPPVFPTDDPVYHLQHHLAAVADIDIRQDPKVVAAFREHVMEHLDQARTMDPLLAVVLKFDLPPQLIGQPGPAAPQGVPGGANAGAPTEHVVDPTSPVEKAGGAVSPPRAPINPLSGERWDPATGGLKAA
jgi:hypothetical protein